jgi:hypothetical protein
MACEQKLRCVVVEESGGRMLGGFDCGQTGRPPASLDYRYRPCNFVEILPRLDEHLRRPSS